MPTVKRRANIIIFAVHARTERRESVVAIDINVRHGGTQLREWQVDVGKRSWVVGFPLRNKGKLWKLKIILSLRLIPRKEDLKHAVAMINQQMDGLSTGRARISPLQSQPFFFPPSDRFGSVPVQLSSHWYSSITLDVGNRWQ